MAIQRITGRIIEDGAIEVADVADNAVTTAKIADGNVTAAKIDTVANTQVTGVMTTSQVADSAITTDKLADANITTAKIATTVPLGTKNMIINGDMRIDQRNAGASVTPTNSGLGIDRWQFGLTQASKFTAQQSSDAPTGFSHSMVLTSSSAYSILSNDIFFVRQKIEGFNSAHLEFGTANAKTVTLSFWVKSSLTGDWGGSLQNSAENRSYPFTYTINSANTWEQKTVTISGDTTGTWIGSTNGIGLTVHFGLGNGSTYSGTAGAWATAQAFAPTSAVSLVGTSGATLYITGVQLEVGDAATPFEHRSYGAELALCQRYYETGRIRWRGYDNGYTFVGTNFFKVTKRAVPTLTTTSGTHGDATVGQFDSFGSGGNFDTGGVTFTATAEL